MTYVYIPLKPLVVFSEDLYRVTSFQRYVLAPKYRKYVAAVT